MTEETIEKLLKEKYSAKVANPDKAFIQNTSLVYSACEAIKQLLEQHEAEMVEFAEFCRQHDVILNDAIPNTKRTTDLLTLFKNRNK